MSASKSTGAHRGVWGREKEKKRISRLVIGRGQIDRTGEIEGKR